MIPAEITAGNTYNWKETITEYPVATYDLIYTLVNKNSDIIEITAVANLQEHEFILTTQQTQNLIPGKYYYSKIVKAKDGSTKTTLQRDAIEILPNEQTFFDNRTHNEKVLEAINATIENRADKTMQSYTIAGRQITHIPLLELFSLKLNYEKIVTAEKRKNGQLPKISRIINLNYI